MTLFFVVPDRKETGRGYLRWNSQSQNGLHRFPEKRFGNEEVVQELLLRRRRLLHGGVRERRLRLHLRRHGVGPEEIEKSLNESNPGNNGICGFFFEYPEISPEINVSNFTLFLDKTGEEININKLTEKEIIRAVFESKAFLLKLALEKFGIKNIEKVIVTGGSSKCFGFLQIISDVFNCEIYKLDNAETAALGAALRAYHGYSCQKNKKVVNMQSVIPFKKEDYNLIVKPRNEAHLAYREVLKQFSEGLEKLVQKYPYNK